MIKIEIKGLNKAIDKFGMMSPKMKKELGIAVRKSAIRVGDKAKPITPWDSTRMRTSIRADIDPFRAVIEPHVEYAIYIHEGTKKYPLYMPPKKPGTFRQFMKIGAKRATPEIQRFFDEAVEKAIK